MSKNKEKLRSSQAKLSGLRIIYLGGIQNVQHRPKIFSRWKRPLRLDSDISADEIGIIATITKRVRYDQKFEIADKQGQCDRQDRIGADEQDGMVKFAVGKCRDEDVPGDVAGRGHDVKVSAGFGGRFGDGPNVADRAGQGELGLVLEMFNKKTIMAESRRGADEGGPIFVERPLAVTHSHQQSAWIELELGDENWNRIIRIDPFGRDRSNGMPEVPICHQAMVGSARIFADNFKQKQPGILPRQAAAAKVPDAQAQKANVIEMITDSLDPHGL